MASRLRFTRAAAPAGDLWPLIAGVRLAPGHLAITLDPGRLAAAVGVPAAALKVASTRLQRTFQTHRRGIETRIVTGTPAAVADPVLQQTLARAHRWLARIRAGTPEAEIARTEGHAESHIRTRLNLPAGWSAHARILGL